MSKGRPGTQLLPCWADRAQAEMRLVGPGKDMVAAEIGLAAFCDRLWLWVAETGSLPPAFCEGDGVRACQAPDLIAWLAGRRRAAVTAQPGRRVAHLACGLRPCPRAMPLSLACALQFRDPQT